MSEEKVAKREKANTYTTCDLIEFFTMSLTGEKAGESGSSKNHKSPGLVYLRTLLGDLEGDKGKASENVRERTL